MPKYDLLHDPWVDGSTANPVDAAALMHIEAGIKSTNDLAYRLDQDFDDQANRLGQVKGVAEATEKTVAAQAQTLGEHASSIQDLKNKTADIGGLLRRADTGGAAILPPGVIAMYASDSVPAGWLLCMGGEVSRVTYGALFQAIGTRYGAGNGSTTFNLPDLSMRFPLGRGNQAGMDKAGATGGEVAHTLTVSEMPVHSHYLSQNQAAHSFSWGDTGNVGTDATAAPGAPSGNKLYTWQNSWNKTQSEGSGMAHNNMPPYIVIGFIIKAF